MVTMTSSTGSSGTSGGSLIIGPTRELERSMSRALDR
jgi:hypothetical protein